jgi:hypothetical protein
MKAAANGEIQQTVAGIGIRIRDCDAANRSALKRDLLQNRNTSGPRAGTILDHNSVSVSCGVNGSLDIGRAAGIRVHGLRLSLPSYQGAQQKAQQK